MSDTLQKLFTRVTGLTWDVNKLTDEQKKKWLIPDGSMLDNAKGSKLQDTLELLEQLGLSKEDKVELSEEEKQAQQELNDLIESMQKPDSVENTDEQNAVEEEILNTIAEGTKTYTVPEGSTLNNFTMPESATVAMTVTGEVSNGATISTNSTKSLTVQNTGEPVDVIVEGGDGGSIYLRGEYNNIYTDESLPVASSQYPVINGDITIDENANGSKVTVSAHFSDGDHTVQSMTSTPIQVSHTNYKTEETTPNMEIIAPNSTVTMTGEYDEVVATVSEDTLILNNSFHANRLTLKKGNIFVNGLDINDMVNELVLTSANSTVSYNEKHVSNTSYAALFSSSLCNGKIILDTDIEVTKGRTLSTIGSGVELIDFNGHSLRCGDTRAASSNTGSFFLRGNVKMILQDSVGSGEFVNNHSDYLIWNSGSSLDILSGNYSGYVHTVYSEKGVINIYGGTFKLLGEPDLDPNGEARFLLNCLDANYTNGTASINVYGGKFYNFNPADNYAEGEHTNFVAPGYKVEKTVEDGVNVYTVSKED